MYQVRYCLNDGFNTWYNFSKEHLETLEEAKLDFTSCCNAYPERIIQLVKLSNYPVFDRDDELTWVVHSIVKYRNPIC